MPFLQQLGQLSFATSEEVNSKKRFFRRYFDEGFDGIVFPNPYIIRKRREIYLQARAFGLPMVVYDRGALPGSWFFDAGFNADSPSYRAGVWDHPLDAPAQLEIRDYINDLTNGTETLEDQGDRASGEALREKYGLGDSKVLFVPFQRPSDTVMQFFSGNLRSIGDEGLGSGAVFFEEMDRLAELVQDRLPGWKVIAKRHPLESETPTKQIAFAESDEHVNALLEMSDAVLCVNSGVGLLALAFGKPVMHFGRAFYSHPQLTRQVRDADEVFVTLREGPERPNQDVRDRLFHHLLKKVYSLGSLDSHVVTIKDGTMRRVTTGVSLDSYHHPEITAEQSPRKLCLVISPTLPLRTSRGSGVRTTQMLYSLGAAGYAVDLHVLNREFSDVTHAQLELELRQKMPFLRRVLIVNHPDILMQAKKRERRLRGKFWSGATEITRRVLRIRRKYRGVRTFDFQPLNFIYESWKAARGRNYDLLYVNYARMHLPWLWWLDVPARVLDTHDVQTHAYINERIPRIRRVDRRQFYADLYEASERYILDKYDGIIAISSEDHRHFQEEWGYGDKVRTIPATFPGTLSNQNRGDTKRLLFVGSENRPNVPSLAWLIEEVFPLLSDRVGSGVTLDIVGNVIKVDRLQELFAKKVSGPVTLNPVGKVNSLDEYYAAAGIVLAPLVRGTGMKIKVIEAMAYGKPVVGTPIAFQGIPAKSGEEAFIAENAQDFARALEQLIVDPDLAENIAQCGHRLFQAEFSQEGSDAKLTQFLKELDPRP